MVKCLKIICISITGHDDRVRPRVSFKNQAKPSKERNRHLDIAFKHHLDDDITMSVGSNNNGRQVVFRGRGRGNYNTSASRMRGRNSPLPHRMSNKFPLRSPQLALCESNWYKVTVSISIYSYSKNTCQASVQRLVNL